jgi:hypothetical protein
VDRRDRDVRSHLVPQGRGRLADIIVGALAANKLTPKGVS